jgi:hypothetical protein
MQLWNKPIRISKIEHIKRMKEYDKRFNENSKYYGVTNWMVGTCDFPWSPWVQIHIGYFSIQIKWYLIVLIMMALSFILGKSL